MARAFPSLVDLLDHGFDTVIDVRAPGEFADDAVPGAVNLSVLNDQERARVGTIYKQESPFLARKIGAALVARNAASHIESALSEKPGGWRPLVYCWRGGQRSRAFASILSEIGWRVETLDGGYKSYRRLVVDMLYERPPPPKILVLDGNTGTAKTELLSLLGELGVQILDLEGLANHRGSLLGRRGPQPSQKGFETGLAAAMARSDPSKPLVVEGESSKIGKLALPPPLFQAMRAAPRIVIEAPVDARASYLLEAYGDALADREAFADRILVLKRLRGGERVTQWSDMVRQGALKEAAAALITEHYDPAYAKSRARQGGVPLATLHAKDLGPEALAQLARKIADLVREYRSCPADR
ncbi:MAG: tRNA 2-selenouridine(34) synthase MnmH [Pseudomonadota bacterium]